MKAKVKTQAMAHRISDLSMINPLKILVDVGVQGFDANLHGCTILDQILKQRNKAIIFDKNGWMDAIGTGRIGNKLICDIVHVDTY